MHFLVLQLKNLFQPVSLRGVGGASSSCKKRSLFIPRLVGNRPDRPDRPGTCSPCYSTSFFAIATATGLNTHRAPASGDSQASTSGLVRRGPIIQSEQVERRSELLNRAVRGGERSAARVAREHGWRSGSEAGRDLWTSFQGWCRAGTCDLDQMRGQATAPVSFSWCERF